MPEEQVQATLPGVEAQPVETQAEPAARDEAAEVRAELERTRQEMAKLQGMVEVLRTPAQQNAGNDDALKAQLQQMRERIATDPAAVVDIMFDTFRARDDAWRRSMDEEMARRDAFWSKRITEQSPKFRELQPVMEQLSKTTKAWQYLTDDDRLALAETVATLTKGGQRPVPAGSPAGAQGRSASAPAQEQGPSTGDPLLDAKFARVYGEQPASKSIFEGR